MFYMIVSSRGYDILRTYIRCLCRNIFRGNRCAELDNISEIRHIFWNLPAKRMSTVKHLCMMSYGVDFY